MINLQHKIRQIYWKVWQNKDDRVLERAISYKHHGIIFVFKINKEPNCIFRLPESLRWPIAACFCLYSFVESRRSFVDRNFCTFLTPSLESLNQFQPQLAYSSIKGVQIVKIHDPCLPGAWWGGAKTTILNANWKKKFFASGHRQSNCWNDCNKHWARY